MVDPIYHHEYCNERLQEVFNSCKVTKRLITDPLPAYCQQLLKTATKIYGAINTETQIAGCVTQVFLTQML